MGGVYALEITLYDDAAITFGAAGDMTLTGGRYMYIGSAPNESFARVERHKAVASGENDTTHWHIDYLLNHDASAITDVWKSTSIKECDAAAVARRADGTAEVGALGASDCECRTHLFSLGSKISVRDVF